MTLQELHANNMRSLIRDSNKICKHSRVIKNECQLSCTVYYKIWTLYIEAAVQYYYLCNHVYTCRSVFQNESVGDRLLIIQCESGHKYIDLIACARYRVLDERTQALTTKPRNITHVVFIISLPRRRGGTKFVGFQGGIWDCYHMDCLMPPKDALMTIQNALYTPINDILSDCYVTNTELLHKRLHNWVSLSLLHSNNVQMNHTILERFNLLSQLIKEAQTTIDTQRNQNLSEDQNSLKQNGKTVIKL